ncbi:midasin [Diutina catenulata]
MDNIRIDVAETREAIRRYNHVFTKSVPVPELGDWSVLARAMVANPMAVAYALEPVALQIVAHLVETADPAALAVVAELASVVPSVTMMAEYLLVRNLPKTWDFSALLAIYRLVTADYTRFSPFVPADEFSRLLSAPETSRIDKYLLLHVLARYLQSGEHQFDQMVASHLGEEPVVGELNGQPLNYKFLPLSEASRMAAFSRLEPMKEVEANKRSKSVVDVSPDSLSHLVTSVCGVLVPRMSQSSSPKISDDEPFVPTKSAVAALRSLARLLQKNRPVMLHGPAGSGKTFMVSQLARYMGYADEIVKIHLGEQTDSKLLLGTYTSGDQPGTFVWRAGVLTTAVAEGKWVVIEDIDKAPTEVLSVLLTLLEKRSLTIASRGETIQAANGFQLLATVRTTDGQLPDLIGARMWTPLALEVPSAADLITILEASFPLLSRPLITKFVACFDAVVAVYAKPSFLTLNNGSSPRTVSFRDCVKLCRRCNHLMARRGASASAPLSSELYDDFFAEAVDSFAAAVCDDRALMPLIEAIGGALEVPTSRIELFRARHVPQFVDSSTSVTIGRARLDKGPKLTHGATGASTFAKTNHSLRLMEQIAVSIDMVEPVLLVGETGTGKTTVVQQMASLVNQKITVINVSQQTEVSDLLGGYKPVNTKLVALPLQEHFTELFTATFSQKKNAKFAAVLSKCIAKNQWKNVARLWNEAVKMADGILVDDSRENTPDEANPEANRKKRRLSPTQRSALKIQWAEFASQVTAFELQALSLDNSFVFDFVEGSLVKAVRNGEWLLLDELNLASPDTLEAIADLLTVTISQRSILLSERGDIESVKAAPGFRIFGCMNPSTDVGKRDLPVSIRSRFSEIYVHSPDRDIDDLCSIIDKYIGRYAVGDDWLINDVAQLYLAAKDLAATNRLVDGAGQRPHFSIRTLTRTLSYVGDIVSMYGIRRSLYEGFSMSFLTLLDIKSESVLLPVIKSHTVDKLKNANQVMKMVPRKPDQGKWVQFQHYLMKQGPLEPEDQPQYIITPYVEHNLLNLVRATSGRRYPVLVQGPTSAGKTSMIQYLAAITGHKFVRINNHEHTDLQEYLGTYVSDSTGKLTFQEGILVNALRHGHWIVLDELNLAPTDVLEALNRLLDDNRELFIPETQEVVRPHPDFMLFATQNPPGLYGGRKQLSRAFRNRFLELHFDDIPQDELEDILVRRCQIAPSYGKKIVEVYKQLSVQRQSTRLFEQKNSFATLRDLFRWAQREAVGYEQLAANGYMLLAERVRQPEEKQVVKSALEKVMRVKLDIDAYYQSLEDPRVLANTKVVWTGAMRRLAVLVATSLRYNEPLLLVGETGCGKTTVCQVVAEVMGKELVTVNAHQNTETGDILGAQRPARHRNETRAKLGGLLREILQAHDVSCPEEVSLDDLLKSYDGLSEVDEAQAAEVAELRRAASVIFEWNDGPLVQTMKSGDFFLLDEISLADDSVLERLNSVLEPERTLLLAEKGTTDAQVVAHTGFEFLATMNPGGDYGKKELSPALRNRFTEIWVPSMESFEDVAQIVGAKLSTSDPKVTQSIVAFAEWYAMVYGHGNATSGVISLRDILAWVTFINNNQNLDQGASLVHGAAMVFIDALGTNNTAHLAESGLAAEKARCITELSRFWGSDLAPFMGAVEVKVVPGIVQAGDFAIPSRLQEAQRDQFALHAPTTAMNAMRVVRAMQLSKPILLEGSPGVGKTSLVTALARASGNPLVRINLSEQTDLVDLFGSDAPGENSGEFEWRDAPFLRAMQTGEWVLLDEMNLASQSVLEGLNACLDHRGQTYIPELDKTFECHPDFRVFAAQNPQYQGGGRKGLPKSFVNRFTVVYVDTLSTTDLLMISSHLYPSVDEQVVQAMIAFVGSLETHMEATSGGPWEFNLRDTLRWLELYSNRASVCPDLTPADFFGTIFAQRFRTPQDRTRVAELYEQSVGPLPCRDTFFSMSVHQVQANGTVVARRERAPECQASALHCNAAVVESVFRGINYNLPVIVTGPTNAGKTELLRFVGAVVGVPVVEFAMNADVDSMDILGGYEQVDWNRKAARIRHTVARDLAAFAEAALLARDVPVATLRQTLEFLRFTQGSPSIVDFNRFFAGYLSFRSTPELVQQFEALERVLAASKEKHAPKFEWFDGMLVEAVEQGHWLVLDNANLCNPSVLDRLNSLLETNGALIVNECANENGEPRVIIPHPNFRLFLTVDPKYGELSRAMRNRGIEVFVDALPTRMSSFDRWLVDGVVPKSEGDVMFADVVEEEGSLDSSFPTLRYIRPSDSATRSYGLLASAPAIGALSFTAIDNLTQAPRFDELKPLSERLSTDGVTDALFSIHHESWAKAFAADGSGLDAALASWAQSLHPLANNAVLAAIKESSGPMVDSAEPTVLFTVVANIINAQQVLQAIEQSAMNTKAHELSYIEASAAAALGRELKKVPRVEIYTLVLRVHQFIVSRYEHAIATGLFTTPVFAPLLELQTMWGALVQCAATAAEARLAVFHELMGEWCGTYTEVAGDELPSVLAHFRTQLSLVRGTSMVVLWERFRSAGLPQSAQGWQFARELMAVCARFDEVARQQFADSAPAVVAIVSLLQQLWAAIIADESSELVTEMMARIRDGCDKLAEVSDQFVIKRENRMATVFANVAISRAAHGCADDPMLDFYACTATGIRVQQNAPDALWARVFASASSEPLESLFVNHTFMDTLEVATRFGNTPGHLIDQTTNDARQLHTQMVAAAPQLLSDSVERFAHQLRAAVVAVVEAHELKVTPANRPQFAECLQRGVDEGDMDMVFEAVQLVEDESFQRIFSRWLAPSLLVGANWYVLGRCYVLFGAGLLQLYVPQTPYDPAIREYVVWDKLAAHREAISSLVAEWAGVRRVLSGDEPMHLEHSLAGLAPPPAPRPRVYRNAATTVDGLVEEWNAFMEAAVDVAPIEKLLGAMEMDDPQSVTKAQMVQTNARQFLQRVTGDAFVEYADLNQLLVQYIGCIQFGLHLLVMGREAGQGATDGSLTTLQPQGLPNDFGIDVVSLASAKSCVPAIRDVKSVVKKLGANSALADRLLVFLVTVGLCHDQLESVEDVLQVLYHRWSLRRIKEEEKNAESWYKFTDPDEDIEGDFRKLFPDYEEALEVGEGSVNANSQFDAIYAKLSRRYVDHWLSKKHLSTSELVSEGSVLATSLRDQTVPVPNTPATMAASLHQLDQAVALEKDNESNFYYGTNASEFARSYQVVQKVFFTVSKHLVEWPDHATLNNIKDASWEYMQYSLAQHPLARCLAKIEQIYTYVAEWQKYASSQVTMQPSLDELTRLIVSWRQLELKSWQSLFAAEREVAQESVGKWWFYLFETIVIGTANSDEEVTPLISALTVFVSQATYGDFVVRLDLVDAFGRHMAEAAEGAPVVGAIANFVAFYRQFVPCVADAIAAQESTLQKDISEVILLASWKDVNVDALKQSSRKSHQSLYKIVRKYRATLATPVKSVIEQGVQANPSPVEKVGSVQAYIEQSPGLAMTIPNWSERPQRLRSLTMVLKNVATFSKQILAAPEETLLEWTSDLLAEMDRLKRETPSTLTEENKKTVAALKTQKYKLLSSSIKEIRAMGIKTGAAAQKPLTTNQIICAATAFAGTQLESADGWFLRILDLLPRLRYAVSAGHDEIPQPDLDRAMAATESLVTSAVATRAPIARFAAGVARVQEKVRQFDDFANSESVLSRASIVDSIKLNEQQMKLVGRWLPQVCEFAQAVAHEPSFGGWAQQISDAIGSGEASVRAFGAKWTEVKEAIRSWMTRSSYAFVGQVVLQWMDNFSFFVASNTSLPSLATVDDVENDFRALSTSVLVSVQAMVAVDQDTPAEEESEQWFKLSQRRLLALVKSSGIKRVSARWDRCISTINSVEFNESTSAMVQALASFTLPLVAAYADMVSKLLQMAVTNYFDNSKATYLLMSSLHTVATQGMCSPQPPQQPDKNDDKLHDGTGLGDGEGAETNNDDVENDDDLAEEAQKANEDQKEKDDGQEDKEDNAVEMDGDMAGDLEDASDQDDDDQDKDEEEQDLDEEIDDIDDLDPNAVDEKMWDEEAKEDTKEKETDQIDQATNDQEMEANEDENEAKDQPQEKPDKGQEEEEGDQEENEDGEDGEEDDVAEQEDDVRNEDGEKMDDHVPESEVLDLPEDMNLDGDDEEEGQEDGQEEMDIDDTDDETQGADQEDVEDAKGDEEMDEEAAEGEEDQEDDQDLEADQNDAEEPDEGEPEGDDDATGDAEVGEDPQESDVEDMEAKDEPKTQETGVDDDAAEGADGMDADDEAAEDMDAAAKQETGETGEGADAEASDEKQDLGGAGSASNEQKEDTSDAQDEDSARQDALDSIKELGDALKEFHRRRQEIKEHSDSAEQEEQKNVRPDEFEHVDGANTNTDTQALGAADSKEQIQSLDDDMAIDEDEPEPQVKQEEDEEKEPVTKKEDEDVEMEDAGDEQAPQDGATSATMGERKQMDPSEHMELGEDLDIDESDEEEELMPMGESQDGAPAMTLAEAREKWTDADRATQELASGLCEQLRLILEPTLATKLRGDYKTGKRLNMKRIIPYIASEFRKDKIWLRRTKPSKRQFQIMIAVDDSKSMAESNATELAFNSIALVSKALTQLESGGLSVVRFGEDVKVVHPFERAFSQETGPKVFQWFDFAQTRTDIRQLCARSLSIFDDARATAGNTELWQLQIILSDGVCEDHATVQRLVRQARDQRVMMVFVVMDGISGSESILDMSQVSYQPDANGNMALQVDKYLDSFPFEYYVVVKNIQELPEMLALILRQYFSEVANT